MLPVNPPPRPQPITKSKVLIVEGRDAQVFFVALLRYMKLAESVEVRNFGGVSELATYLETLAATPGFADVDSLGIIRDAEEAVRSAFQSVCSGLKKANLSVPRKPITATSSTPRVSVFILPDCEKPGMLETLCLQAVEADSVMPCVDNYLECVQEISEIPHVHKARLHAFLASRQEPGLLVGQAAEAKY